MSNIDMKLERGLLTAAIDQIAAYDKRENELLHELKEVRNQRAEVDGFVQRIMVDCEESRLSSDNFRELLDGILHQVSVSLTRHSFRGV